MAAGHSGVPAEMAGFRLPIGSVALQALVSEPVKPCLDVVVMADTVHRHLSQSDTGEMVIGGGADGHVHYSQNGSFQHVEETVRAPVETVPMLSRLKMLRQWAGIVDMTGDRSPILSGTPVEKLYLNRGWRTGGFKAIPAGGRAMAEMIAKGEPGALAAPFSLSRFREGRFIDESVAAGVAHRATSSRAPSGGKRLLLQRGLDLGHLGARLHMRAMRGAEALGERLHVAPRKARALERSLRPSRALSEALRVRPRGLKRVPKRGVIGEGDLHAAILRRTAFALCSFVPPLSSRDFPQGRDPPMLLVERSCCGALANETELAPGGEAPVARAGPESADGAFEAALFLRDNPRGIAFARWRHAMGCGRCFHAAPCTLSMEVFATYPATAAEPPSAIVDAIRAPPPGGSPGRRPREGRA